MRRSKEVRERIWPMRGGFGSDDGDEDGGTDRVDRTSCWGRRID